MCTRGQLPTHALWSTSGATSNLHPTLINGLSKHYAVTPEPTATCPHITIRAFERFRTRLSRRRCLRWFRRDLRNQVEAWCVLEHELHRIGPVEVELRSVPRYLFRIGIDIRVTVRSRAIDVKVPLEASMTACIYPDFVDGPRHLAVNPKVINSRLKGCLKLVHLADTYLPPDCFGRGAGAYWAHIGSVHGIVYSCRPHSFHGENDARGASNILQMPSLYPYLAHVPLQVLDAFYMTRSRIETSHERQKRGRNTTLRVPNTQT